jgi:hypothetical protein
VIHACWISLVELGFSWFSLARFFRVLVERTSLVMRLWYVHVHVHELDLMHINEVFSCPILV